MRRSRRKRINELNRYSDEKVHLWTCRTVETLTVDLNGYQKDCMKMNRQGHERVRLWAGTQAVVETGRSLWFVEREA